MRIIGGEARGRRLYSTGTLAVRPTTDRIKEACFNIIGPVAGKTFLDLFAGSGNMGLEALSRGALKAVFVEKNRALIEVIHRNMEICGFSGKGEILASDFIGAVQGLVTKSEAFDILFADPPYEQAFVNLILQQLEEGSLMKKDALLVVQHSAREAAVAAADRPLVLTDQRRYRDTILSFFKKRD